MTDRDIALRTLTGLRHSSRLPPYVGTQFDGLGRVLQTPGNVWLCHIDPTSEAHRALSAAQQILQQGARAAAFTFPPPESFHLRIFDGVRADRRAPPHWPQDLPLDTPLPDVTAHFTRSMQGLDVPVRFRLHPTGLINGSVLNLTGSDRGQQAALQQTRDRLRAATGLNRSDHSRFQFSIELAYQIRWLAAIEVDDVLNSAAEAYRLISRRIDMIEVGPIEFCSYETLHRFEPVTLL